MEQTQNAIPNNERKEIQIVSHIPKPTDNIIQLFLAKSMVERLQEVCAYHRLKPSEYVRIAIRNYNKYKPDLSPVILPPTTGGTPMRFSLQALTPPDADTLRRILHWKLSLAVLTPRPPPRVDPRDLEIMGGLI